MIMSPCCEECLLKKYLGKIPPDAAEERAAQYRQRLEQLVRDRGDICAPEMAEQLEAAHAAFFGPGQAYGDVKRHFNSLMLGLESDMAEAAEQAEDPLLRSVQLAMVSNFIDFGAMDSVDENELRRHLQSAGGVMVDADVLSALRQETLRARRMVYITDNCGEIVADKLLIRRLKQLNPQLHVTALVRGKSVINDASMEDALQVGLHLAADEVIGSGCGTAGTVLHRLGEEAGRAVAQADVLIAKGQGNYESLSGCGLNLFYLFMCKCQLFVDRFHVPRFSGLMVRE